MVGSKTPQSLVGMSHTGRYSKALCTDAVTLAAHTSRDGKIKGISPESLSMHTEHEKWVGEVTTYSSYMNDDDFIQPAALWKVIGRDPGHQDRTIDNLAASISGVKSPKLRNEVYSLFSRVDQDLGRKLKKVTEAAIKD